MTTEQQNDAPSQQDETIRSKPRKSDGENLLHFKETLNVLEKFFLFMSKTEMNILQYCTRSTRLTLTSVGGMVVITGVLAFFSAFFTIKNCFFRGENTEMAWGVSIVAAMMYSIAIMAFDREVVSSTTFWAGVLRIPLAGLIGVVIAFPMELQLQHGRISAELDKIVVERNKPSYSKIKTLEDDQKNLLSQSIQPLESKKVNLEKLRDQEQKSADWESRPENGLCRGKCAEHKSNAEGYQKQIDQVREQIIQEQDRITKSAAYLDMKKEVDTTKESIRNERRNSNDLLSQKVALDTIHKHPEYGSSARSLSFFLMLFFICFEMFPVLIKMTMPYTEYHAYLDARMRINVSKIAAISNYWWKDVQNRPEKLMTSKTEVTDLFAEVLEDKEKDINDPNAPEDRPHA